MKNKIYQSSYFKAVQKKKKKAERKPVEIFVLYEQQ